jgi:hypothetical protein
MMQKTLCKQVLFFLVTAIAATAQVVSVSRVPMQQFERIPADQAIEQALMKSSLTDDGPPFHALMEISKPTDKDSPFEGTVEIYWLNASHSRVTVTSKNFQQTRIVNRDAVEEQNTGDFYPGWLRNYALALLDPLHRAELFRGRAGFVAVGEGQMRSCISRDDRPGGITDQMTWASICFQGADPLIESAMDFTSFMEFGDYQKFGKKQIARSYTNYDADNEKIIGRLKKLEALKQDDANLFAVEHPTPTEQQIATSFVSMATNVALIEKAPAIEWPTVREGKTDGYMIIHVLTDRTGQVREAYRHNSDNPGLEDFGREQALKFKFKPLLINGVAQQMETPLVLHFTSHIADPLPVVTGEEINKVASGCGYDPVLPAGLLPSGTSFKIRVSVNEQGKNTGEVFPSGVPWNVIQKAKLNTMNCHFKPYLVNGQPWYYHIDFVFSAP